MGKFILKRLLSIIVIFFIASIIIFLLVRLAPGDVAASIAGGGKTTEATLEAIRAKYHLNDPLIVQYGVWIRGILQGDWGISYQMNTPVLTLIAGRIGLTCQLLIMSFAIGILVSPAAGHSFSGETGNLYGSCYIRTYHGDGGMSRLLYRDALHAAVFLPTGMVSGIRIREKCGGKPVLSVPPGAFHRPGNGSDECKEPAGSDDSGA